MVRAWSERARGMTRAGPRIGMGLPFVTEVTFGPRIHPPPGEPLGGGRIPQDSLADH